MTPRALPPELHAELSALLDGELDGGRAAELRARIARDPELAAAYEALAAVDRQLRATPPSEISPALTAQMRARFDAERVKGSLVSMRSRRGRNGAPRRRRPLFRTAAATAALAATIAAALLLRSQFASGPEPTVAPHPDLAPPAPTIDEGIDPSREAPELFAPAPRPAPTIPVPPLAPELVPPAPEIAERSAPPAPPADRPVDAFESASDEELALALQLEALGAAFGNSEDLAIIEALEFVEALREEDLEGRGRG